MAEEAKWLKPAQAAKRIAVSKTAMYRMLPRLAAEGVEIVKLSERITLIDLPSLQDWVARQRLGGLPTSTGIAQVGGRDQ